MGQITELRVDSPFMKDNYRKYLDEPLKIGFTEAFPEKPGGTIADMTIQEKCMGFDISLNVRYCWLTFGPKNEYEVRGIVTDKLDISSKLPVGGWGSFSHIDTGQLMEKAIILLAARENLIICNKTCSWPFAKAVVQPMSNVFDESFQ